MNLGKRTQREKKFMKGKWSVAHVILMWAPNSPMFGFGDWGLLGTDNILHFLYVLAFYLWKSFPLFVSIMIEIQFIQCALKVFSFRLEWEGFQIFNLKLINCLQIELIFKLIHEEEFTCFSTSVSLILDLLLCTFYNNSWRNNLDNTYILTSINISKIKEYT